MSRNTLIWRLVFLVVLVAVLTVGVVAVVNASENDEPETRVVKLSEDEDLRWARYRIDGVECIAYDHGRSFGGSGGLSCDWTRP